MISFIKPIDWTLTSTTNLGQGEFGSNDNEEIPHIFQSYKTEVLPSNAV